MTQEKDDVLEILNSHVSYWDGLTSSEFWKRFGVINGAFAVMYIMISPLTMVAYFIFSVEIDPNKKLILLLVLPLWSAFGIYSFHNQLRLYQLDRQLRIIKLAQEPQETNGESF